MKPLDIAQIEVGTRAFIEELWQQRLPQIPLPALNLRTLRKALAFELQMKTAPSLSPQAKQTLAAHAPKVQGQHLSSEISGADAHQAKRTTKRNQASSKALAPGAVLIREWNGRRYQVMVGKGDYEMDGRVYRSLSQIAKAITGAHWSGPRFFGLVKAPSKKNASQLQEA